MLQFFGPLLKLLHQSQFVEVSSLVLDRLSVLAICLFKLLPEELTHDGDGVVAALQQVLVQQHQDLHLDLRQVPLHGALVLLHGRLLVLLLALLLGHVLLD